MLKSLMLDIVEVTKAAAIAAHGLVGLGDEKAADQAAVNAMRSVLARLPISGTVVIGEGERDKAPMLYIGEELGAGGHKIDIAVDPLEGTAIVANNGDNAMSVIAVASSGSLLHAPDVYMDKIAIGFEFQERIIDLDNSPIANLKNIASASGCGVDELVAIILDRPRHEELIAKVREAGARVKLIGDGDVAAVIATSLGEADVYMGIGGAPEGVLAATALKTLGGQMCTRLLVKSEDEQKRAEKAGISDFTRQYTVEDMARGDVIFAATGVTSGWLLQGVEYDQERPCTETLVMYSGDGLVRKISDV